MIDLDALEAAVRAMTPGPWKHNVWYGYDGGGWTATGPLHDDEDGNEPDGYADERAQKDATGIVALRNNADALIAEVRWLRAELAELRDILEQDDE